MPTKEALEIYEQAVKLVNDDLKDKQAQRDGAAMLHVALEQAGGPFPEAEAELANAYLGLRNEYESKTYADRALKADPNNFTAQYVKTVWAFSTLPGFIAGQKFKSELNKLIAIFETTCRLDRSADWFIRRSNTLKLFADLAAKEFGISTPRVFVAIAAAPIDHLEYENDEQRAEVKKLRIIAQGRSKV